MSKHDTLLSRNLGKAYTATSLGVEVDGIDPMPEPPPGVPTQDEEGNDLPTEEVAGPAELPIVNPDPDEGFRVFMTPYIKATQNGTSVLQVNVHVQDVRTEGGLLPVEKSGFNAFQFKVEGGPDVPMSVVVETSYITHGKMAVQTGKKRVGGFGSSSNRVNGNGIICRLNWKDFEPGPYQIKLSQLRFTNTSFNDEYEDENGEMVEGGSHTCDHYPNEPRYTYTVTP